MSVSKPVRWPSEAVGKARFLQRRRPRRAIVQRCRVPLAAGQCSVEAGGCEKHGQYARATRLSEAEFDADSVETKIKAIERAKREGRVTKRTQDDIDAERAARAQAERERGCYCGYWDGVKLYHPHPKCSCDATQRLRAKASPK